MKPDKKKLSIGFDLDGVLLYNPARIVRPFIAFAKKNFLKRNINKFYYPKNRIEQFIWNILHKSSIWPASGINQLLDLAKRRKIKVYIISARYEFLKKDFEFWIKKIDPTKKFSGYYFNDKNEQPHLYKEKMIKELGLDIFVEDNWDIVVHLRDKLKVKSEKFKVYWIYNLFDSHLPYQYKFPNLKSVVYYLKHL